MRTIGITGGVGSGKTEVLSFIAQHYDARIIVADLAAKEMEQPGGCCYAELLAAFGNDILDDEKKIDAKKFSAMIFSDPQAREKVNAIIHPAVKNYILSALEEERARGRQLFVLEAALLIEEGYQDILDEMWYIYVEEEIRRRRLKESRGYTDQKIDGIMAAQKKDEEFRKVCRHVIDNNGTIKDMQEQIVNILGEVTYGK